VSACRGGALFLALLFFESDGAVFRQPDVYPAQSRDASGTHTCRQLSAGGTVPKSP